jgi:hypothetical protein
MQIYLLRRECDMKFASTYHTIGIKWVSDREKADHLHNREEAIDLLEALLDWTPAPNSKQIPVTGYVFEVYNLVLERIDDPCPFKLENCDD